MKNSEFKNKHNHALTQWLKVGIFSLLMLAPLIASVSQWIYATVNKNAYQNYSGKNEILEYVETGIVELGEDYRFKPAEYTTDHNITLEFINKGSYANSNLIEDIEITNKIILRTDGTIVFYQDGTWLNETYYSNFMFSIDLELTAYYPNAEADYNVVKKLLTVPENKNNYLDNAFYYGVDQMTKSDLFNWTQNTALYTGIKGMTDNLEIGTPAIAILITYWTILTIAYVIIDILITGFTWITHLIVRND